MALLFYPKLTKSYLLFLVATNISFTEAVKQNYKFSGNAKDYDSNEPLIGVNIVMEKLIMVLHWIKNGKVV